MFDGHPNKRSGDRHRRTPCLLLRCSVSEPATRVLIWVNLKMSRPTLLDFSDLRADLPPSLTARRTELAGPIAVPPAPTFTRVAGWHYLTESTLLPRRTRQCILIVIISTYRGQPMTLQITNPVVVDKVGRLAKATGLSKTAVVERALDHLISKTI